MSLKLLQTAAGVTADGIFGENTFKAGSAFLGITNKFCAWHFWGQVAHESGGFKWFEENGNYSAAGLLKTFGKYFSNYNIAYGYAKQPVFIFNRVYANRMGNGDEDSGDGDKFHGRGALQLTGKNNYKAFSDSICAYDIMDKPEMVADQYAFESAMWFFNENKIWALCKKGISHSVIEKVTRKINGGTNGLSERIELTDKYSHYEL